MEPSKRFRATHTQLIVYTAGPPRHSWTSALSPCTAPYEALQSQSSLPADGSPTSRNGRVALYPKALYQQMVPRRVKTGGCTICLLHASPPCLHTSRPASLLGRLPLLLFSRLCHLGFHRRRLDHRAAKLLVLLHGRDEGVVRELSEPSGAYRPAVMRIPHREDCHHGGIAIVRIAIVRIHHREDTSS